MGDMTAEGIAGALAAMRKDHVRKAQTEIAYNVAKALAAIATGRSPEGYMDAIRAWTTVKTIAEGGNPLKGDGEKRMSTAAEHRDAARYWRKSVVYHLLGARQAVRDAVEAITEGDGCTHDSRWHEAWEHWREAQLTMLRVRCLAEQARFLELMATRPPECGGVAP